MPASFSAPRRNALLWIACAALGTVSCGKRDEAARGPSTVSHPAVSLPAAGAPDTLADSSALNASAPEPTAAKPDAGLTFLSHPPKAYLGKAFVYKPSLDFPGAFSLRLAKPADSTMKLDRGRILWTPTHSGRFPVLIEAFLSDRSGQAEGKKTQQGFILDVAPVVSLVLRPLPPKAHKGDSVEFDLRQSRWPAWAAASISVRFDWEGDGVWDTEALPLAAQTLRRHAYAAPGRFAPKVEARYGSYEVQQAGGAISIVGKVTASVKISPDTVEPGAEFLVDASSSRSESRLAYSLDLDGDGKPEWIDSASGKATLKAPASGMYHAQLTVRDAMGETDKAETVLCVNARPKIEFRVRNPRDNMSATIDFKIRAKDPDDSLRSVRFSYSGGDKDWETRAAPDSQTGGHEWYLRLKHAYGKVGKYAPKACVTSGDGREACQELQVEIFNAPPECRPGGDLHATLGQPIAIDGTGVDPHGKIVKWEWDLDGDGEYDLVSTENGKFQYTFSKEGTFKLVLRVTSADGMTAIGSRKVEVRKKWKT
ncbi:MAG: hypothetical protein JF616_09185 [Fibrobacteres bacterium]|nr:hypothetical protein [Fibrobacterota bacterium]